MSVCFTDGPAGKFGSHRLLCRAAFAILGFSWQISPGFSDWCFQLSVLSKRQNDVLLGVSFAAAQVILVRWAWGASVSPFAEASHTQAAICLAATAQLPGPQSVPRAELAAVIVTLSHADCSRDLLLCTDGHDVSAILCRIWALLATRRALAHILWT